MKKAIPFAVILAAAILIPAALSYADYIMPQGSPPEPALLVLFFNDRHMLVAGSKEQADSALRDDLAVLVNPGTRCLEIERDTLRVFFHKKPLSRVLLVNGPHKGASGWVLSENVRYENAKIIFFDSGDTILMLQNGRIIRGDLMKMDKKGVQLSLFEGSADIFLKRESIARMESFDRGYGKF